MDFESMPDRQMFGLTSKNGKNFQPRRKTETTTGHLEWSLACILFLFHIYIVLKKKTRPHWRLKAKR